MTSPIAVVDKAPQVRSLFAKFDRVNDPVISEFTASIPEKFEEAVDRIVSSKVISRDYVMHNRAMLKSFVRKFHVEAGTLTADVENSIALLSDPTAQILVSTHQPNLFAYGGIFKKIVLLESLKNIAEKRDRSNKTVNLFLIVDHDFVDESWIRLAQLPSMLHASGIMELRLPISESKRWQMVCNVPVPRQTIIGNWKHQIKSWINMCNTNVDKKLLLNNLDRFWQHVETSHSRAKSYADLNSFIMSKVVNEEWNYSTLFVRLSEISSVFENGFTFLISNFDKYSDALRRAESVFLNHNINTGVSSASHLQAPVWVHCHCGSKASSKITKNFGRLTLAGSCMSCKKELELDLGYPDTIDLNKSVNHLSPRAIPIPLLLSRDLGISCYVSGTGGIGYLIDGSIVSKKLGLELPLVLVWPSKDVYTGIGQAKAMKTMQVANIDDIYEHLQSLSKQNMGYAERIKPLLDARAKKIKADEDLEELLAKLFELKEEQRKIRSQIKIAERIRNAISISPCIVDYAVNFGIADVERKWRTHLVENGNLSSSILFERGS